MLYGFSGLPGAGKTLNAINSVLSNELFAGRRIYYHRIPCLMFDYEVCQTFQGWFYGWFLHNNRSNTALLKKVANIHQRESRLVELEDFPYLERDHEESSPFAIWLYWVRRCYPESRLKQLDELIAVRGIEESELTFEDVESLELHFREVHRPQDWPELPSQSVFLADEIHHYWPTRTRDAVPKALEAISTHRHTGKDLIFITQDFANVDVFIRRMVNYHTHFEDVGAGKIATYKRKKYIDINNPFDKKAADKSITKHPTHLYGAYYSTEMDTKSKKLSTKAKRGLQLGVLSLVVLLLTVFVGLPMVFDNFSPDEVQTEQTTTVTTGDSPEKTAASTLNTNRLQPWDNPKYKPLLTVNAYPDLLCYVIDKDNCKCVTQQATRYDLEFNQCQALALNGLFDPYKNLDGTKPTSNRNSTGLF
ncbi:hypothetical protein BCT30_18055 [Enterovibrio norvegicus]|uniref:zonular occludens toxin domain-containing protein n=1 Tax=Enterovibrio norvegicus TaxID=188144 RepID=UPI000C81A99A|nr:zonular occludens toxin domain-containing protein [Enterovibrio norvegicus]MCC4798665.1 zonular occludens toxin domain-containing protein [Enterovibrio norvegicus]PMI36906.1 hypothetical protein BCU46_01640 [Enterovibrio norvegicus]PMN49416.1 hypothetical protein BCT30_18055 [Enterovibrio norvegicus]